MYDDNVVKFSIRQGEENDRWAISGNYKITASDNEKTYITYADGTTTTKATDEMVGSFTIGELVCTRDTNRVFLGNFSDALKSKPQQQTLGGVLSGNKYLGYVDSKPLISSTDNGTPESLSTSSSSLLNEGSRYRSYHHLKGTSKDCIETEDHKWCKQAYYNEKYDAYDGDYMYDIYRNALILFDHHIKPSKSVYNIEDNVHEIDGNEDVTEKKFTNNRRRTPLIPYSKSKENQDETVYNHTSDMYGDGYVLLYNVIPDGKTLTFEKRDYNKTTGKPTSSIYKDNYSQNIIKINELPIELIYNKFNNLQFSLSGGVISVNSSIIGQGSGNDFSASSLKNIYNKTITASRVLVTDGNGYISEDSGINSGYLTGLKENIQSKLNSLSSNFTNYATKNELANFKTEIKDMLPPGSTDDTPSGKIIDIHFLTSTIDDEAYNTAGIDGNYTNQTNYNAEYNTLLLKKSSVTVPYMRYHYLKGFTTSDPDKPSQQEMYKFAPQYDGFLILVSDTRGKGYDVHLNAGTIVDNTDDDGNSLGDLYYHLCSTYGGDGNDGGGSVTSTLPVKAGQKYALYPVGNTTDGIYRISYYIQ